MSDKLYSLQIKKENINDIKYCMFCGKETSSLHLLFKRIQLVECDSCKNSIMFYEEGEPKQQSNEETERLYDVIKKAYHELKHPDPEFSTYKACAILKEEITKN